MAKYKYNFSWRTAPRSIQVLLKWLPYFYNAQGESWTSSINGLYPLRRALRWEFENDSDEPNDGVKGIPYEEFILGKQNNNKDLESLVRQQFTTAEQFGFMSTIKKSDSDDQVLYISEAGRRIVEETFTPEDFLIQLLKMFVIVNRGEEGIFPFKIFSNLLYHFESLSRYELTFMFGVTTPSKYDQAVKAIDTFRDRYNDRNIIPNKLDNTKVEQLLKDVWEENFGKETFLKSWKDYTDAFLRAMIYTNMFYTSGRGYHTKVRISENSKKKFNLLIDKFTFEKPTPNGDIQSREAIYWYGGVGNIPLPWDNFEDRKDLVKNIFEKYKQLYETFEDTQNLEISEIYEKISSTKKITVLKDIENDLHKKILHANIKEYVERISKTEEERQNILERFDIILEDNDMSALWLEVNTWKSLVSLEGNKEVIPNFTMEADLTPRAFAPGIGNTPDMEVHAEKFIIVPEVSLMTGKVQWEHEGSSVIDHVTSISNRHPEKDVIGIFLSSSINYRTLWQFFVLNKSSWLGKPIPVIPLTIRQYTKLINDYFENGKSINDLYEQLKVNALKVQEFENYKEWEEWLLDNF